MRGTIEQVMQSYCSWDLGSPTHDSQGTNAGGTVYYRDKTIYSYGEHFPMAHRAFGMCSLMTSATYSPTTDRHMSALRSIMHQQGHVVHTVKNVFAKTCSEHRRNYEGYLDDLNKTVVLWWGSRKYKDFYQGQLYGTLNLSRKYYRTFIDMNLAQGEIDLAKLLSGVYMNPENKELTN